MKHTYDPNEFIKAFLNKTGGKQMPKCPYCGGEKFTTTGEYASLLVNDNYEGVNIGPTIPAGMIICENCGNITLFALGALGLLDASSDENVDANNGK